MIWTPEVAVDHRCVDIAWLYDIVITIKIRIPYNLHIAMVIIVSTHLYRRNISIEIGPQYRLNEKKVNAVSCHLQQAQIIHISIMIKVQIRYSCIGIIESPFKI
jgi:hypothetical protein